MKAFASDLVGKLNPEDIPAINDFAVEPSRIDAIINAYHKLNEYSRFDTTRVDHYAVAWPLLTHLAPFTEDEVRFAFHHLSFVKTHADAPLTRTCSTILSILVNLCPAPSLTITPPNVKEGFGDDFEMPEQCIGKWYDPQFTYPKIDSKRMLVAEGNVHYACRRVAGGTVRIKGNADGISNSQRGGHVIVHGDVTGHAGVYMQGGILTINGVASGKVLAYGATGGTINIKHAKGSIANCGENVTIRLKKFDGGIDTRCAATVYVQKKTNLAERLSAGLVFSSRKLFFEW